MEEFSNLPGIYSLSPDRLTNNFIVVVPAAEYSLYAIYNITSASCMSPEYHLFFNASNYSTFIGKAMLLEDNDISLYPCNYFLYTLPDKKIQLKKGFEDSDQYFYGVGCREEGVFYKYSSFK